jgi:hypothetical protein
MQLNVQRIEERIHKLQEIKRIAADPEMVKMLMEFISLDEEPRQPGLANDLGNPNLQPRYDDMGELAKVVTHVVDEQPRGGGLWARTRG